jgi:hypothetical protein
MLSRASVLAVLLVVLAPARSGAVTIEDLIALSRQGVADDVLVAVIDADRTVFSLSPEQIVQIRKAGVHDPVIVKMLGSAREFADDAAMPHPVVVIGGQPSAPAVPQPAFNPFYVYVPVPVAVGHDRSRRTGPPRADARGDGHASPNTQQPAPPAGLPPAQPAFGRFINDGWVEGLGFGRFINDGTILPPPATRAPR